MKLRLSPITVVAGAVSLGLHGFLLSQWPSPFVQPPSWTSSEPMTVIYVPAWIEGRQVNARSAALTSTPALRQGSPRGRSPEPELRSASGHGSAGQSPRRASAESAGPRASLGPVSPVRRTAIPEGADGAAPANQAGVGSRQAPAITSSFDARSVPSLLTPADFAAYQYKQLVRDRLRRAIRYPARANGGDGSVRLQLTVGRTGALQAASCEEASVPLFAAAAMEGVEAAAPFPPMPDDLTLASETYEFFIAFLPNADPELSP